MMCESMNQLVNIFISKSYTPLLLSNCGRDTFDRTNMNVNYQLYAVHKIQADMVLATVSDIVQYDIHN